MDEEIVKDKTIDRKLLHEWLIKIPAGIVGMRDDRIKKLWDVKIESFLLSKFPVTQSLYEAVTHENPSMFKGDNLPIENVTWKDAIIFCNKLSECFSINPCYTIKPEAEEVTFDPNADGFRLPTEAQWQYACQAGTREVIYDKLDLIAWYKENSGNQTHPVGLKKPNQWGLYDMLGNVWEWCSDIYDETVYGSYRVLRGGGWCDAERSVMSTTRRRSHPFSFKIEDLGFRIAFNRFDF